MTDIVVIKLSNDKEIVGKYTAEDDFYVFVKDPLEVQTVYDMQSGVSRCVMAVYMPFAKIVNEDVGIPFSKTHLLHCLPVADSIEKYYNKSLKYINATKTDKFKEDFDVAEDYEETDDIMALYKNVSKAVH